MLAVIANLVRDELDRIVGRIRSEAILLGLIGFLLLVAIVALLVAADLALASVIGPVWAPVVIAAVALFLALVVYLAGAILRQARRRREDERRRKSDATAALTSAALTGLPMLLGSRTVRRYGIPVAVAAALVLLGMGDRRSDR